MPKEYFKQQYIEACDLLIRTLEERFDQQQSVAPVLALENLLLRPVIESRMKIISRFLKPIVIGMI